MRRRHLKRLRPMSDINVVPYIDVMLVLLIIFMVTAPLLSLGVNVDLPQANANPIEDESQEPVIVSISKAGEFFLNISEESDQSIPRNKLREQIEKIIKYDPGTPILVRGDTHVPYGKVMEAMVLIQQGGAPSVGLITDPPEE